MIIFKNFGSDLVCIFWLKKMVKNTAKITIFFLGGYAPQTALNPLYVIWYANIE